MASVDADLHRGLGASLEEFEGAELPASYGDDAAEFAAIGEGAGLLERSHRAVLEVRGSDRSTFLQRLLSNDTDGIAEGEGAEAMLLTPKGMLIAPLLVLHRGDRFHVELPGEMRQAVFNRLSMYVLSAAVEVEDLSGATAILGIHGPRAEEVLAAASGAKLPDSLLGSTDIVLGGTDVLAVRVDYLGQPGFDLHHPSGATQLLHAALREGGAVPVGFRAAEMRRIEAGVARFGAEMTEGLLPPEVPALAERAISYEKGCYVGQETISRLKAYGHVNRELRGLVLGGDRVPKGGEVLCRSGQKVGVVTSACLLPGRDRPIALSFVKRRHFDPGTQVEVEMEGGIALATVVTAGGPWEA